MKLKKKLSIQVITTLFQRFGTSFNRFGNVSPPLHSSDLQNKPITSWDSQWHLGHLCPNFFHTSAKLMKTKLNCSIKTIKQGSLRTLLYFFLLEQMTLKLALLPLKLQVSLHYHIWQRKNHVIHFTTTNFFGESQRNNNKIIRHFTRSNVFWTINKLLNLAENFMSNNYFWTKKNYERTKYQVPSMLWCTYQ